MMRQDAIVRQEARLVAAILHQRLQAVGAQFFADSFDRLVHGAVRRLLLTVVDRHGS